MDSRLVALMFTDIVDSTGIKSRVSTSAYTANLQRHNVLFEEAVAASREAKIIKHTGDGFFARFHTASDAARCALKFQRDLADETWPGERLRTRIGIHMGEIAMVRMLDRTDIIGSPADVAARVMSLGTAGQILLSKLAADEARRFVAGDGIRWTRHGYYKLKGVDDALEICEIADVGSTVLPAPIGAITKAASVAVDPTLDHPDQIGPYRIVEPLGEGGMGTVFKAEQRSPVKRTVALKLIKLGLGSKEVIARFESERQALARMDHPHIAKVLDAGQDTLGRPYFVMEYVPGAPITQFADDNKLSIRDRLELFIQACEAIAHAHTKAIIHRDVKASNVLAYMADGKPVVKVIDFGIAKAMTGDRLTDLTFNTERGRAIGTYESMSPEQADGSPDIDTRTDVYSLGVLLYELLSGAQPFEKSTLAHAADNEIRRIIREVEPPRPSTRLTSMGESATKVAALRCEQLDALCKELRGELEWIPLKAMRKARDRRYASALIIADDIRNYLEQRPLIAGPESRTYRFSKWVRRNRSPVIAATLILIVLALGAIGTIIGFNRDAQSRNELASVIKQLVRDTNDAALRQMGKNDLAEAASRLNSTIAKAKEKLNPNDPDVLRLMHNLASALQLEGKASEATKLYRDTLLRRQQALGAEDQETLLTMNALGALLRNQRQYADAEPLLRECLTARRKIFGDDSLDTILSVHDLGSLLRFQEKYDEAEPLLREALNWRLRNGYGDTHPHVLDSYFSLGIVLQRTDRPHEAEPMLRKLYSHAATAGIPPATAAVYMSQLGVVLARLGKFEEAESPLLEAHKRLKASGRRSHAATREVVTALVLVYDKTNRQSQSAQWREQLASLPNTSTHIPQK